MQNIILLVGHTRNLDLCADSIIKNLCIPNDAKVIGFTYDCLGYWPNEEYNKNNNIKLIWKNAFKDYLLNLYIKNYSPEEIHQDNQLANILKNNNDQAPTNHSVSMWRTRTQALSILPKNIKLIFWNCGKNTQSIMMTKQQVAKATNAVVMVLFLEISFNSST
jgi:hypothetical protein